MSVDTAILLKLVADIVDVDAAQLTPQTTFAETGRTSFQEVELFTEIEDRFGLRLDFTKYSALTTIGELTEMVNAAAGAD